MNPPRAVSAQTDQTYLGQFAICIVITIEVLSLIGFTPMWVILPNHIIGVTVILLYILISTGCGLPHGLPILFAIAAEGMLLVAVGLSPSALSMLLGPLAFAGQSVICGIAASKITTRQDHGESGNTNVRRLLIGVAFASAVALCAILADFAPPVVNPTRLDLLETGSR